MACWKPATPGFLVTLAAAVLLGIVTFSVPYFKSVFFLKASLADEGLTGDITFGTLGYCLHLSNGTTCTKPSIGYSLDINALVGNDTSIKIPNIVVKWITYALVLHVVALIFAAISAVFGLLAHVREFSMTCCSTCLSGVGAAVALLAFIFDLAFFFIAKSRINAVKGGSASMGLGIWLTLAAWLLLFFAGCFYGLGRCCVSRRPRDRLKDAPAVDNSYAEQMRMEAIRAEAERKGRQQKSETGLPSFPEYEATPLTKVDSEEYMEEGDHIVPYRPNQTSPGAGVGAGSAAYARQGTSPPTRHPVVPGYAQATPGTRAVDQYYNNSRPSPSQTYPPQPRRQPSTQTQAPSMYSQSSYTPPSGPAPPMPQLPTGASNQYLATGVQGHNQYPSATSQQDYGHPRREDSYSLAASHQQYPTNYSAQYPEQQQSFNADTYNATGYLPTHGTGYSQQSPYHTASTPYAAETQQPYTTSAYPTSAPQPQHTPERSYTLGGDNYANTYAQQQYPSQHAPERSYTLGGDAYTADAYTADANASYPPPQPHQHDAYARYSSGTASSIPGHMPSPYSPQPTPSPSTMSTQSSNVIRAHSMHKSPLPPSMTGGSSSSQQTHSQPPSSPQRQQQQQSYHEEPIYEDSPPVYDVATAQPPGEWNSKR